MGHPKRRRKRRHLLKLNRRDYLITTNSLTLLSVVEKIYQQLEDRLVPAMQALFGEANRLNESRMTSVADGSIPLASVDSYCSSHWLTTTGMIAWEIIKAVKPTERHPLMNTLFVHLSGFRMKPSGRVILLRDAIISLDDPIESSRISINGKSLLGYDFDSLPVPFRIVDPEHRKVKRMQRIRGYRDKGSLAPSSSIPIRQTRVEHAELTEIERRLSELKFLEHTAKATKVERTKWFEDEFGADTPRRRLENAIALFDKQKRRRSDQG